MPDVAYNASIGTYFLAWQHDDGHPPHTPRGCPAQAWSVAEVLRAWFALRE